MRIPTRKTIPLALAILAAVFVAGCGGGGETSESTATTTEATALTKAELISQGDAICGEVNAAVGALGAEVSEEAVPQQIEQTSNLYIGMVERIQKLGAPEGDDGSYAKVMEAAEELAKVEGEVKLAAEREDTAALGEAASEAAPALEEFESQASAYGFEECGEGPSAPTPGAGSGTGSGEEAEAEGYEEEGGLEAEPEYVEPEYEEEAPEEVAPETGGAGGGTEEAAPGGGESGGSSGGVGPG